jgi:hypothetical protein
MLDAFSNCEGDRHYAWDARKLPKATGFFEGDKFCDGGLPLRGRWNRDNRTYQNAR